MYSLIKIYNFFTKADPESQDKKLDEEINELIEAYNKYVVQPNMANFLALLKELVDVMIIIKQLYICRYNGNLSEFEAEEQAKVSRTLKIIKECNGDPGNYEKVRRKYD